MQQKIRQVIAYKNYFLNFYNGLSDHVQIKIEWTLKLVVLGNAFQKKTQKTPKTEIEKALKIKEEYQNEKQ